MHVINIGKMQLPMVHLEDIKMKIGLEIKENALFFLAIYIVQ